MLIQKGGIIREIEPEALHSYKAKGYTPTKDNSENAKPGKKDPVKDSDKKE